MNIDAEVRAVYIAALNEEVAAIGSGEKVFVDLARFPRGVKAKAKEAVRARIRMLGCSGKA